MNKKQKVSVVIPTCGRPFLPDAVESVLSQDYPPFEIIVVADCTTEGLVEELLGQFSDSRIQIIHHREKLGGAAARNTGILRSTGNLIAFLDDDDVWEKRKLSRQLPVFSGESIAAVFCPVVHINSSGERLVTKKKIFLSERKRKAINKNLKLELLRGPCGPTSTAIVSRAALDAVGLFDETLAARQDLDLWIRLTNRYDVRYIDEPLVLFRQHDGCRITKDYNARLLAQDIIFEKYQYMINQLRLMEACEVRGYHYWRQGVAARLADYALTNCISYHAKGIGVCPWLPRNYFGILKALVWRAQKALKLK